MAWGYNVRKYPKLSKNGGTFGGTFVGTNVAALITETNMHSDFSLLKTIKFSEANASQIFNKLLRALAVGANKASSGRQCMQIT